MRRLNYYDSNIVRDAKLQQVVSNYEPRGYVLLVPRASDGLHWR